MNVAFFGTGLMGLPMAEQLLKDGHSLTVYNRTASKAQPLKAQGARVAASPGEAVKQAGCLITMLTDAPALEQVIFQSGVDDFSGKTLIQMSTIGPSESVAFKQRFEAAGGEYLECPVLGSITEAKSRSLILMVGATRGQFERWSGFFKAFGPHPKHVGEVPHGAALKLAFNQLIPSLVSAFALSLSFVQKQGVHVDDFMELLRVSALYAKAFDNKLPRMLTRNFDNPNFPTRHMLKDIDLLLAEARAKGLNTEGIEGIRRLLKQTVDSGLADGDYSAVYQTVFPPQG